VTTAGERQVSPHKKVKWGKPYSLEALREKLPQILRTAAIKSPTTLPEGQQVSAGGNVIIRPTGPGVGFVQLDDLKTQEQVERVRPAACVIHETSPGNRQAWIPVSGAPAGKEQFKEFMRRVRKAVGGNDKSASHATRLAGTENWKTKYLPNPPTVKILDAHPGRIMTPAQLESLGLLAAPSPAQSSSVVEIHPTVFTKLLPANGDSPTISIAFSVRRRPARGMAPVAVMRTLPGACLRRNGATASRTSQASRLKLVQRRRNAHGSMTVRAGRILDFRDGDFAARFRKLQYLTRERGQGRAKGLFVFHLGGKGIFLLCHCFEEEHQPGFPALFSFADGLLGAAQGKVIAVLNSPR
jgi:hypothetical protein